MYQNSSSLKRVRDQEQEELETQTNEEQLAIDDLLQLNKRQKSYKDIIITLLDDDQEADEPNDDLSSLVSTLLHEISSCPEPEQCPRDCSGSGSEEVEVEKVMRHLLEASDDELGIPNNSSKEMDGCDEVGGGHVEGGDLFDVGEGLWEFEDLEATNYYNSLLQSEIFI